MALMTVEDFKGIADRMAYQYSYLKVCFDVLSGTYGTNYYDRITATEEPDVELAMLQPAYNADQEFETNTPQEITKGLSGFTSVISAFENHLQREGSLDTRTWDGYCTDQDVRVSDYTNQVHYARNSRYMYARNVFSEEEITFGTSVITGALALDFTDGADFGDGAATNRASGTDFAGQQIKAVITGSNTIGALVVDIDGLDENGAVKALDGVTISGIPGTEVIIGTTTDRWVDVTDVSRVSGGAENDSFVLRSIKEREATESSSSSSSSSTSTFSFSSSSSISGSWSSSSGSNGSGGMVWYVPGSSWYIGSEPGGQLWYKTSYDSTNLEGLDGATWTIVGIGQAPVPTSTYDSGLQKLTISGAGLGGINGDYFVASSYNGAPSFVKETPYSSSSSSFSQSSSSSSSLSSNSISNSSSSSSSSFSNSSSSSSSSTSNSLSSSSSSFSNSSSSSSSSFSNSSSSSSSSFSNSSSSSSSSTAFNWRYRPCDESSSSSSTSNSSSSSSSSSSISNSSSSSSFSNSSSSSSSSISQSSSSSSFSNSSSSSSSSTSYSSSSSSSSFSNSSSSSSSSTVFNWEYAPCNESSSSSSTSNSSSSSSSSSSTSNSSSSSSLSSSTSNSSSSSSLSSSTSNSSSSSSSSLSTSLSSSSFSSSSAGLPAGEVSLTISGMTGSNWNGLGNGTHALNGIETLTGSQHYWTYGTAPGAHLKLIVYNNYSVVQFGYTLTTNPISYSTATGTPAPAIGNRLFSNTTQNGVTFTWSKGVDWSRGNM